jgi:Holliday junction resolvase
MVDSRAKGARGEYLVRDMLRTATNLQFERVPNSGALEYLKGDLYVPNDKNRFCIEVKNYSETPLSDKIFTAKKTNNLIRWWRKVEKQAAGGDQEPLLFFKYNRSPVFVVTNLQPNATEEWMYIQFLNCFILLAEDWLENETVEFLRNGIQFQ